MGSRGVGAPQVSLAPTTKTGFNKASDLKPHDTPRTVIDQTSQRESGIPEHRKILMSLQEDLHDENHYTRPSGVW